MVALLAAASLGNVHIVALVQELLLVAQLGYLHIIALLRHLNRVATAGGSNCPKIIAKF